MRDRATAPGTAAPEHRTIDDDPLAALRRRTRRLHAQLDRRLQLGPGPIDRQRYTAFLSVLATVFAPLDRELAVHFPAGSGFVPTPRSPYIRADLDALAAPHPPALEPLGLGSRAAAVGALYVAEGSRLGSDVLRRRLAAEPGRLPTAYLDLDGSEPALAFQRFLALSRLVLVDHETVAEACDGAEAVFRRLLAVAP